MKFRPTFTGMVICLAVASCASSFQAYDGPPLPDTATALIEPTMVASVLQYDHRGLSYFTSVVARYLQNIRRFRVLPGRICVTLRVVHIPNSGPTTTSRIDSILCFDAIAGRTYVARARIGETASEAREDNLSVRTWLMDQETGETLAENLQAS